MIGKRFSLRWRYRHRVEVVVLALEAEYVVCDAVHRCGFSCDVGKMIGGETRYHYDAFVLMFEPMADDAIAIGGAK